MSRSKEQVGLRLIPTPNLYLSLNPLPNLTPTRNPKRPVKVSSALPVIVCGVLVVFAGGPCDSHAFHTIARFV